MQAKLGRRIGQRQTFVLKFELVERRLDVAEFVDICRAMSVDPVKLTNEAEDR